MLSSGPERIHLHSMPTLGNARHPCHYRMNLQGQAQRVNIWSTKVQDDGHLDSTAETVAENSAEVGR